MGRRFQSRRGNGRFTRNTLENTFGLSAPVCPVCRSFNPHPAGEPTPEKCHSCGAPLTPDAKAGGDERGPNGGV
jgi:hypothetical protein